ncbi:hypothetical protein NE398_14125 [Clostridium tertium]|uniref:Uncharacterized protein n=1 Tax=Clostridium tertium TaxID=1559 RepID=A0A9X3XMG4_9CLOT|nr:hypothetical protein [Clostridium tertium]MDC4241291.1 hypothetical protein [Clostridium tertium]
MKTIDITGMIDLAGNADKIAEIIEEYGFYIMLGREEEFINSRFKKVDEFTRRRLIKAIKEANPLIHHKHGLI